MFQVASILVQKPLLSGLALLSLALILGLLLNDWRDKRRQRQLAEWVQKSREHSARRVENAAAPAETGGGKPRWAGLCSKYLRWHLVLPAALLMAAALAWMPARNSILAVRARTNPGASPDPSHPIHSVTSPNNSNARSNLKDGSAARKQAPSPNLKQEDRSGKNVPMRSSVSIVISQPQKPLVDPNPTLHDHDWEIANAIHPKQISAPKSTGAMP